MELAGSENSFVTHEASSDGHSGVDVEGPYGFSGKASRSFLKTCLGGASVFLHSCLRQLGGEMVKCWSRLFLLLL